MLIILLLETPTYFGILDTFYLVRPLEDTSLKAMLSNLKSMPRVLVGALRGPKDLVVCNNPHSNYWHGGGDFLSN
jgi:hypothetical protein